VTDDNGCTIATEVFVNQGCDLSIDLGDDISVCEGTEVILEGPADFASYEWSNGSTEPTALIVQGGLYTLTVTDANGCTAQDNILVTFTDNPDFQLSSTPAIGGLDGTVGVMMLTSSQAPYELALTQNGQVLETATISL